MEFQDVVRRRRMVRNFTDQPVPPDVLDRVLGNALHAPSAGFSQGWAFLVLEGREETERLWSVTWVEEARARFRWQGLFAAPVLIVPMSHKQAYLDRYAEPDKGWADRDESRWPVPFWDIDTGMASLLILLTAVDHGLGGLFFGVPPEYHADVHEQFAIPDDRTVIGVVSLGYAVPGQPGRRSPSLTRHRRTGAEVAHWGRFGVPASRVSGPHGGGR